MLQEEKCGLWFRILNSTN